jgi:hypothetical protein
MGYLCDGDNLFSNTDNFILEYNIESKTIQLYDKGRDFYLEQNSHLGSLSKWHRMDGKSITIKFQCIWRANNYYLTLVSLHHQRNNLVTWSYNPILTLEITRLTATF